MPQDKAGRTHIRKKPKLQQRRKARELVLQALYQWQISGSTVADIESQFVEGPYILKADDSYFRHVFRGITHCVSDLDETVAPLLDRPVDQLGPVEHAILRIGCFELKQKHDVPYRVVINEGIELAKRFGGQDSHKYINGVLDKLAPQLRKNEISSER